MSVPWSGSGQCRVCRGLALYEPVADGPWWTHDDPSADHRVVIDPDTTSYGPDGRRMPSTQSTSAALARVTVERDKALGAFSLAEELRLKVTAELATERDKRAEDIAAFGRACVELTTAEEERDELKGEVERLVDLGSRLTGERDHARSERDALKALYTDAVNRLNTQP